MIDREELVIGLRRLENFIYNMDEAMYEKFAHGGQTINTCMTQNICHYEAPELHGIFNLQLRVHEYRA